MNQVHAYIIEGNDEQALLAYAMDHAEMSGVLDVDIHKMEMSGKDGYKVQDAAEWMERISMHPYGDHKVGIIERADAMGEQVQNKLLKTLEEPSAGTVIMMLCRNRRSLLDTVISRCAVIRLADDGTGDIADISAGVGMLTGNGTFSEYRAYIDKQIDSRTLALALLDEVLDGLGGTLRKEAVSGGAYRAYAADVEAIEAARSDILRGMGYKQALKRLYLELNG